MLDRRLEKMVTVVQEKWDCGTEQIEIGSTGISSANFLQLRSGKILGSRMFPILLLI